MHDMKDGRADPCVNFNHCDPPPAISQSSRFAEDLHVMSTVPYFSGGTDTMRGALQGIGSHSLKHHPSLRTRNLAGK